MEEFSAKHPTAPDEDRDGWLRGHWLLLANGSIFLSLTYTGQSIGCGALVISKTQSAAFFYSISPWAKHYHPSCKCHFMETDERTSKHVTNSRTTSSC